MATTLQPSEIRIGFFGLDTLKQLENLPQSAVLHDIVHGVDGVPRLSPGNVDQLVEYGRRRACELADAGVDPDLAALRAWWSLVEQALQVDRSDAAAALVEQDGRNPRVPSPS